MRYARVSAILILCLLLAGEATSDSFVTPEQFDFDAIIGKPPADDSPQHVAEVDQMLAMQEHRTAEEEKRCKSEEKVDPFVFSEILGDSFNAKSLPVTAQLFLKVTTESTQIAAVAKDKWKRVRPPIADKRIHPCVTLEKTGSFPSGHATRGVVWATLLSGNLSRQTRSADGPRKADRPGPRHRRHALSQRRGGGTEAGRCDRKKPSGQ